MSLDLKKEKGNLVSLKTGKSIQEFIESLKKNAPEFGFSIRHVFDMKEDYKNKGVEVDEGFRFYQVVVCNFVRSYKSIRKDASRAAVLLGPKQIIVYKDRGVTNVEYLPFTKEFIKQALPEDEKFSEGLYEACQRIIKSIKASK